MQGDIDCHPPGTRCCDYATRCCWHVSARRFIFTQFPRPCATAKLLLSHDGDTIATFISKDGYRDVKVTHRIDDQSKPNQKVSSVVINIHIDEGPQYLISKLTVEGIQTLDSASVLNDLNSVEGQPFSEYNVALDRDTILNRYFAKGFANATFESVRSAAADRHPRWLIENVITEGGQEFVRQVIYTGNRHTKPRLINRMLELNPGDPLSPTQMTDTQRKLYNLGMFSRVDTAIQDPDGDTPSKYVLYDLQEGRRYTMRVGVEKLNSRIWRLPDVAYSMQPRGRDRLRAAVFRSISRAAI